MHLGVCGMAMVLVVGCGGDQGSGRFPLAPRTATLVADIPGSRPDGSVLMEQVSGAIRLQDHVIVVADEFAAQLKFFDSAGTLVRTVGRQGQGPREFTQISWIGRCEERILVGDRMGGELTVLDDTGAVVRRFMPSVAGRPVASVTCSPDGSMAYAAVPADLPMGACLSHPQDCAPEHTVVSLAGSDGVVRDTIGQVFAADVRPLGRVMRFAMSDRALYVGTAESAAVDVYRLDGRFERTIALGLTARTPSGANYEAAIAELVSSPDRAFREEWTERFRRVPMPEHLPPYSGLFAANSGLIWVVTSFPGDTTTALMSLLPDGTLGPVVTILRGMRVLDAGDDYVLGTFADPETDEPHVVEYRLTPQS